MPLEAVLARLADHTGDPVVIGVNDDPHERLVWANDRFTEEFGYTLDEIRDRGPLYLHGALSPETIREIGGRIFHGASYRGELPCRRSDGGEFWADVSMCPVEDAGDGLTYIVKVYRNVDALRRRELEAERALAEREVLLHDIQRARQRMEQAINTIPDPFALYNRDLRLVFFNEAYCRAMTGDPAEMQRGMRFEDVLRLGVANGRLPNLEGDFESQLERWTRPWDDERDERDVVIGGRHNRVYRSIAPNGDRVILRVDITEVKEKTEKLERYAAELEAAKAEIEQQAVRDSLTGIGNRRFLRRRLDEMLARRAGGGGEVALLHVDLDRFKQINDTMGHAAGDHVLMEVSRALTEIGGERAAVARIGGDEFIVAFLTDDPVEPGSVAERIVSRLARPVLYEGRTCRFGASVGVATTPMAGDDADALIMNSDIALYRAKRTGRSRAEVFNHDLKREMIDTKVVSDELHWALERGEIEAVYQPQFDAMSLDLIGVEALARWRHPTRGLLSPAEFRTVAGDAGLIGDIDRMVFERGVTDCSALADAGVRIPRLSINVSAERMREPDLVEDRRLVERFPGQVAFELLESICVEEEGDGLALNIDRMKEIGIEFEVDDFGSGRASIIGLTRIAPKRLKIDRRLIDPIVRSAQALSIVKAIVEIGRALAIRVTAEGVETPDHVALLRRLGCSYLQGNLFSVPMQADALGSFIRDEPWRRALPASRRGETG